MGWISGAHDSVESLLQAVLEPGKAPSHLYARHWHPLVAEYEADFAEAVGVRGAVLFNSGMAAIASLREMRRWLQHPPMVSWAIYQASYSLLDPSSDEVFDPTREFNFQSKDVFVESLGNRFEMPVANLQDIFRAVDPNAIVVVDNTLLSPVLLNVPVEARKAGLDERVIVVESATKYLQAGTDRITAGIVYGDNADLLQSLRRIRASLGTHLQPSCVQHLVFPDGPFRNRMYRHSANASDLASILRAHPAVEIVHYPMSQDGRRHGGLLNFSLKGGERAAVQFCNSVGLKLSTSFGFDQTRILPIGLFPESITGNPPNGRVRVAVGIEQPFEPVLEKFQKALDLLA